MVITGRAAEKISIESFSVRQECVLLQILFSSSLVLVGNNSQKYENIFLYLNQYEYSYGELKRLFNERLESNETGTWNYKNQNVRGLITKVID